MLKNVRHLLTAASLLAVASASIGIAQTVNPADALHHLQKLSEATSLDHADLHPWHLRMSFQIPKFEGKPADSGTVEMWWVSPTSRRIVVKSGLLNLTVPSAAGAVVPHNRESYLVDRLLQEAVHPIRTNGLEPGSVMEGPGKIIKSDYRCFQIVSGKGRRGGRSGRQYCAELNADVLRIQFDAASFADVRNKPAAFQKINIALDNNLSYGDQMAIQGHIEGVEAYDPAAQPLEMATVQVSLDHDPGIDPASHVVKSVVPDYPVASKAQHTSGPVVLTGLIGKQGNISSLDVVTTPDSLLTASALDAVKKWRYKPYLLNGEPIEMDAIITVNYFITDDYLVATDETTGTSWLR